jgi:hypothetical protein
LGLESKDTYDKCLTVGFGYRHDVFDARLQLFLPDAIDADDFLSIVLTAGYRFWD